MALESALQPSALQHRAFSRSLVSYVLEKACASLTLVSDYMVSLITHRITI